MKKNYTLFDPSVIDSKQCAAMKECVLFVKVDGYHGVDRVFTHFSAEADSRSQTEWDNARGLKLNWTRGCYSEGFMIGCIANMAHLEVGINVAIETINGKKVAFYNTGYRYVDEDLVSDWMDTFFTPKHGPVKRVDEQMFHTKLGMLLKET